MEPYDFLFVRDVALRIFLAKIAAGQGVIDLDAAYREAEVFYRDGRERQERFRAMVLEENAAAAQRRIEEERCRVEQSMRENEEAERRLAAHDEGQRAALAAFARERE